MYRGKKVTALILAAGNGSRIGIGSNKLLLEILGEPIIKWTVKRISECEYIDKIILVIKEKEREIFEEILRPLNISHSFSIGGKKREDSTYNGLLDVDDDTDLVLTHDGARPFVSLDVIKRAIEGVGDGYDGSVVCVPQTDTVKVVGPDMTIIDTPDRDFLYNVQTPQVFKKDVLLDAYRWQRKEGIKTTDDSNIVEKFGGRLRIIVGNDTNIKVTTKKDLFLGEYILKGEDL